MKNKILIILFLGFIFSFSILGLILKDQEISFTERRKLTTFPEFTLESNYSDKLDKYFLDHFPLRDTFRSIKALYNYKILHKTENNDIVLVNNGIYKSEYPTNTKSIENYTKYVEKIKSLLTEDNNTYMMIIPDKNYYLSTSNFLQIDYDYLYNELSKLNINEIDVRDILNENDYYRTDTHWKQENLDKVIKEMSKKLSLPYENISYKKNTYNKFYGVYYGESAINSKPDTITYLTNDYIDNAKVTYLENNNLTKVYNLDKLDSLDSYEVYLDGASSFIEIENDNSLTDKELVIFRDSFGSSITPLLIPYYKKITVIDNRYISSNIFSNYIEFTNQDIIFLNSTLIVNKSNTLKY